jgi:hypothetical protein
VKLDDIRKLNPCYDPNRYLPENWEGSVSDILRLAECPEKDRIWVAVRLIDEKTARLFAVWCAREALARVSNPDPRSIAACDVTERYAHGEASIEELEKASAAAAYAAYAATAYAANAAYAAAAAANAAATAYASYAAVAANAAAAYAAVADAANAAAYAANASAAERKKQIDKLLEIAEGRNEK